MGERPGDGTDDWEVKQTGIDGDPEGQTTLDGGIKKEVRRDD
jgi:hypothetical protein